MNDMPDRPADPLDRIEAVLESWGERDWMPTWKDDGFVPQLLALVAVARAARERRCNRFDLTPCSERPEIDQEDWCSMCAALDAVRIADRGRAVTGRPADPLATLREIEAELRIELDTVGGRRFGRSIILRRLEALAAVERLVEAAREMAQAIEDAYGGFAFVPEESFEREALEKGRSALAPFSQKEENVS